MNLALTILSLTTLLYSQCVQEYTAKRTTKDAKAAAEFLAGQRANQNFTN